MTVTVSSGTESDGSYGTVRVTTRPLRVAAGAAWTALAKPTLWFELGAGSGFVRRGASSPDESILSDGGEGSRTRLLDSLLRGLTVTCGDFEMLIFVERVAIGLFIFLT